MAWVGVGCVAPAALEWRQDEEIDEGFLTAFGMTVFGIGKDRTCRGGMWGTHIPGGTQAEQLAEKVEKQFLRG
jgi:hypothetical protein